MNKTQAIRIAKKHSAEQDDTFFAIRDPDSDVPRYDVCDTADLHHYYAGMSDSNIVAVFHCGEVA